MHLSNWTFTQHLFADRELVWLVCNKVNETHVKSLSLAHQRAIKNGRQPTTHHSALLWWLDLSLKMRRQVKVATSLTVTSSLDKVHADSHMVVSVHRHAIWRVRIATLRLTASAHATLILAANLHTKPHYSMLEFHTCLHHRLPNVNISIDNLSALETVCLCWGAIEIVVTIIIIIIILIYINI